MVQQPTAPALLTSKLHPPRVTAQHIARPRLIERLSLFSDRPLILICAAAGSGKSSLLTEWLAGTDLPSAWLSLDEHDNDLVTFVTYVLAAISTRVPTASLQTRNLLQAVPPPPFALLAASLSHDLDELGSDVVLVLDDYHVITNPEIDQILGRLLLHPPRALQLVVASRTEPAWPLATLREEGLAGELRYSDLQFTRLESEAFLRRVLGEALDQDQITVLHEESEGWAAGLKLMSFVADRDDDGPRNWRQLTTWEDLTTSLFSEVIDRQPDDTKDLLFHLSILGRFSASLGAAVRGDSEPGVEAEARTRTTLRDIEQQNLFLIALDAHGEFYRFHHLFQRFLREWLQERMSPEDIATLHRRASVWFASRGLIEEALDHALAGGDATLAADLVARHRHDLYNHEQFSRLTRLLRLLPSEVKEHNPELLLAEARIATLNWRFTEAEVFLDHAEHELSHDALDAARAEAAAGELAVLRGILDLWSGNAEQLLAGLQSALQLLPRGSGHLRGLAHMGVAAAYWQLGQPFRAKSYLAEQLSQSSPDRRDYPTLLQAQAFLQWVDGDLAHLHLTAQRLLQVSRDLALPDQIGLAHYFLGIAHYARGELEAAHDDLTLAVAARFNMRLLWWSQAAGCLALTLNALAREQEAQETLAEAHDFLLERHALRILPSLGAFQAVLDRQQGRLAEASAWAAGVEPGPLTWPLGVMEPRVAQALIFLTQERESNIERAALLIAELQAFCQRVPNPRLAMEVEALGILLADRRGDREGALISLQRLVPEAETQGRVRLFVDFGAPMERLLRQLAVRRRSPAAITRALSAFPAQRDLPHQTELAEPLTEREQEILALLKGRDSNREIAERLFIAPSTVKRHTLSIYRKLEVSDRRAAVARAIERGLLSDT
jgi:LuxR family transcriptional regulator, maltose regulon positive regulatory protein